MYSMQILHLCVMLTLAAAQPAPSPPSTPCTPSPAPSTPCKAPCTSEYVALMPANAGANGGSLTLGWMKLEYPVGGPSKTSEVSMTMVNDSVPEIGDWFNVDVGSGAMLSAKIEGEELYMYANRGVAPTGGGCCADTMRVFAKSGASSRDIDLEAPLKKAIPSTSYVHATHTFDISLIDGTPHAFLVVQYGESSLDNAHTDAIAAINLVDGSLKPTADGDLFFDILAKAGTTDTSEDASRFKVQFDTEYTGEQWHGNGMDRFTTKANVTILAFTHRFAAEAILFKDPWTYTEANGGGKILQRFGNPTMYKKGAASSTRRAFGVDTKSGPSSSGVHNVFYQVKANGTETVSMFANGVGSDAFSHVFEFEVKLADEQQTATSDDVFDTAYSTAPFTFTAQAMGGARAIGNGVWIGASGAANYGYQVVDSEGATLSYCYSEASLYDPFVRVLASSNEGVLVV